jgi:hypothetical protein
MAVETERRAETRRRRPPRPPTEDGRRLASAGRALGVTALALLIAALLNAQNIYKSVYNQPEGTQREVALAFAGPLRQVSMALRLDRPRAWVESAIGRDHATIDTGIVLPPTPPADADAAAAGGSGEGSGTATPAAPQGEETPAAAPDTEKPVKAKFTPDDPMRLWIAGDSLVITPGYAVYRALGQNDAVERVGDVDGRVATGLTRPDVFNWFRHVDEQVRKEQIDTVVFGFGGNDDSGSMTGLPDGVELDGFGKPKWTKEYRRRVGGLMDTANQAGAFVVWLGLPITKDGAQSRRWKVINRAALAEAERRPGTVAYVDMYGLLADDGTYAPYLPSENGQLEKVRADDGVHLERAGGDIVARQVVRELRRVYDLWSWRNE